MRLRIPLCALLCTAFLVLAGCKQDLYTGLSEQEANEMISVLYRQGIDADRVVDSAGSVLVRVDRTRFQEAVESLKAEGYPRQSFKTLGDVFQGNGFVVSHMEERARFIYAMSEELSRTVAEIDGVLGARIHVVLPASNAMSRDVTPSSASVVIRYLEDRPLNQLAPQIKMLVANSIEGLSYDMVSVVFIPVARAAPPPASQAPVHAGLAQDIGEAIPVDVLPWVLGGLVTIIMLLCGAMLSGRRRHRRALAREEIEIVPAE